MDSTILLVYVDRVLHLQNCLVKGFTSWDCNDDDYEYKSDKKGGKYALRIATACYHTYHYLVQKI